MRSVIFLATVMGVLAAAAWAFALDSRPPAPASAEQPQQGLTIPKEIVDWQTGISILSRSGRSLMDQIGPLPQAQAQAPTPVTHPPEAPLRPIEIASVQEARPAVSLKAGGYQVELAPHASVRLSEQTRVAEAGGVLRTGPSQSTGGPRSKRWFMFVGANGRLVDWRTLRAAVIGGERLAPGDVGRSSALIGTAEAGVAWRAGPVETTLALVRRSARYNGAYFRPYPANDSVLSVSVSFKPKG